MLTFSRPLSAAQVLTYHAEEFSNARENYYTRGDTIASQWHGQLATRWGLSGDVTQDHVAHLAHGRHPITGEQLVLHQTPRSYVNAHGKTVTPMAHRAAWDGMFSAPKSVSITALVGEGDARVRAAHQASVRVALDAMERMSRRAWGAIRRRDDGAGLPPGDEQRQRAVRRLRRQRTPTS